ncbi:hypothetical protein, partial [Nocardia sp. JMUB6875]|uniref:hypothetical protein n=1 Tax=Nocardia sp. JMUB6875 TaxID=3158170 RepID=UPI0034E86CCF
GLQLRGGDLDSGAIGDCAARLMPRRANAYRDAAREVSEEIARMPAPAEVVGRLRDVVAGA